MRTAMFKLDYFGPLGNERVNGSSIPVALYKIDNFPLSTPSIDALKNAAFAARGRRVMPRDFIPSMEGTSATVYLTLPTDGGLLSAFHKEIEGIQF